MRKIKRIYHPYWDWECYHAGFFKTRPDGLTIEEAQEKYKSFLGNDLLFSLAIRKVFNEWPKSCEQFLTNPSINRVAFIGQAAMCISNGIPSCAKGGFSKLTQRQQDVANSIAKINLERWLNEFESKN